MYYPEGPLHGTPQVAALCKVLKAVPLDKCTQCAASDRTPRQWLLPPSTANAAIPNAAAGSERPLARDHRC